MSWLHAFELMCYTIVIIMLIDLVRKKDYNSLFTFGSAALVGFVMNCWSWWSPIFTTTARLSTESRL